MSKNQSNKQITPAQKEKASRRLLRLQPVLKGAAKSVAYLAAGVTAYCLLPGTPAGLLIPAALTPLIETIGPDLLAGIVEKVVEGKEKSNDDLFAILESAAAGLALNERQLANLPTRRDLYRAISYLAEQADKNQQQILANQDEILAALQQILSSRPSVPLFHGVPDMPTYFLGREELVTDLAARLTGGQTMALSAEGLPGVGKTALAAALAHDKRVLAYFSDGVLWAGLGKEGDALSALAGWAEALGGDVSQYAEVPARSQAVKNMIGQRRLLLVIDDAWESEAADALRCGGPGCVHLLTTRLKDVAQGFAGRDQAAFVPELEEDPAFALLQAYAPDACATNPEAAQALVQAVGGLPLALELLGGYLGATRRSATTRLSQKALAAMGDAQQRLTLACRRLGDLQGREVTLQETIFLSLQGLEAEPSGAEAVNAFYALGAMAPKPADFTWAAAGAAADCDEEAIAWLLERNLAELVDDDEGRLALHQALADVARAETDAAAVARHREYYLAAVNKNRGDWRRIERLYDQISWAWNHLPEDKNVLDYIWALRIYQERRGLWADYIDWVNRGLEIAQANDLKQDQGTLLNNLGGVYRGLGQPEKALQYFNEALPISQEVGNRFGEAATLNNLGEIYRGLGQMKKALRYFNAALPILREVGDRAGEATTLNNLGDVYRGLGQMKKALRYLNKALPISREVGDRAGEATTLNNLGEVYRGLGQMKKARRYYNEALPIRQEVGDRAGEATTLNNLGLVYHGLGQQEEALRYLNTTLPIRQEVGDRAGEATTLNNLGGVYDWLGQPEKAWRYLNEALPIIREVGDRMGEATTLNNLGEIYRKLGQPEKALRYLNKALPISQEVGDRAGEAATLNNLGEVYRGLGQLKKARRYYYEALPISREVGDRVGEATKLNNLGLVYRGLEQPEKALEFYNAALPIMREVGDRWGEAVTRYNILLIYWDRDELAAAYAEMKIVVELTAAVQSPYLARFQKELAQLEAALAARK